MSDTDRKAVPGDVILVEDKRQVGSPKVAIVTAVKPDGTVAVHFPRTDRKNIPHRRTARDTDVVTWRFKDE